jgi:hypothetical protein
VVTTKKCSKCKEPLPLDWFSKNAARYDGLQNVCKVCTAISKRANRERNRKYVKAWGLRNPEKVKARKKKGSRGNSETRRMAHKRSRKRRDIKDVINCHDRYIKKLLCDGTSLKPKDIPQELVELKRKHLKVHRQLKTIQQ